MFQRHSCGVQVGEEFGNCRSVQPASGGHGLGGEDRRPQLVQCAGRALGQQAVDGAAQRAWLTDILPGDLAEGAVVLAVVAAAGGERSTSMTQVLIVQEPVFSLAFDAGAAPAVRIEAAPSTRALIVASSGFAAGGAALRAGSAPYPLTLEAHLGTGGLLAGRAGWGGQVSAGSAQCDDQPGQHERQRRLGELVCGQ